MIYFVLYKAFPVDFNIRIYVVCFNMLFIHCIQFLCVSISRISCLEIASVFMFIFVQHSFFHNLLMVFLKLRRCSAGSQNVSKHCLRAEAVIIFANIRLLWMTFCLVFDFFCVSRPVCYLRKLIGLFWRSVIFML